MILGLQTLAWKFEFFRQQNNKARRAYHTFPIYTPTNTTGSSKTTISINGYTGKLNFPCLGRGSTEAQSGYKIPFVAFLGRGSRVRLGGESFFLKFVLERAYSNCLVLRCNFPTFTPNQISITFYNKKSIFYIKIHSL